MVAMLLSIRLIAQGMVNFLEFLQGGFLMCVSTGVSAGVSTSVSTSSRMGIVVPIGILTCLFIISSIIGNGTSSMTIGSTILPDRKCNSLHGMGVIE